MGKWGSREEWKCMECGKGGGGEVGEERALYMFKEEKLGEEGKEVKEKVGNVLKGRRSW